MKAQSLSVVVPNKNCVNHCAFCVSRMSHEDHKNQMDDNLPFFDLYLKDYLKRLDFAQRNGCNTVMLTGNSEPQQNRKFLTYFGLFMQGCCLTGIICVFFATMSALISSAFRYPPSMTKRTKKSLGCRKGRELS